MRWLFLSRRMPFNEVEVLKEHLVYVSKSLQMPVEVRDASAFTDDMGKLPVPGCPTLVSL